MIKGKKEKGRDGKDDKRKGKGSGKIAKDL